MTAELAQSPRYSGAADGVDLLAVNTIRMLAADAVQAAGSGHPGLPMGAAAPAWVLWSRFLRHDPTRPDWPDRDRFVLSAGHGSMLLYALLHLFGYGLGIDELRAFRQWGSLTPGHPEHGHTAGVETTTGPLGQGLANAVGMALAERMLAARSNTDDFAIVGHRTWVLASDGDLMEGISHEAASLAGHLGLGRLTVIYDDNDITIDGPADQSCSDDAAARFASYGWQTIRVADGNDLHALARAYTDAMADEARPCLISVRTTIGYGAPNLAGTSRVHGAPLGAAELAATRTAFDWPDEEFHVPAEVARRCVEVAAEGKARRQNWERVCAEWAARTDPERADAWRPGREAVPPTDLDALLPIFEPGTTMATRKASGMALAAVGASYPQLVGGSADLASSTNTTIPDATSVDAQSYQGRTLHFGIREHAMGAALNGMALHGGLRPYGSTFLVFSDYLRPSIRLAALMGLPVTYVFTHDSIAVGEDGPTHQPVEQTESLRLIPNLAVLRPADANETAACWSVALHRRSGPSALVLSRQDLPVLEPVSGEEIADAGARIVTDDALPDVALVAAGSEVGLAVNAAGVLRQRGLAVRVLSVPWRERFEEAGTDLLPPCPAVWIEAGVPNGWQSLARPGDSVLGLRRFGASAPGPVVYGELGFTVTAVVERVLAAVRSGELEREA